jgi:hypothetical protein
MNIEKKRLVHKDKHILYQKTRPNLKINSLIK